jgi:hypothetical protein
MATTNTYVNKHVRTILYAKKIPLSELSDGGTERGVDTTLVAPVTVVLRALTGITATSCTTPTPSSSSSLSKQVREVSFPMVAARFSILNDSYKN